MDMKNPKQAGTVLGQAQLKLELELHFTSFTICCIKWITLLKLLKLTEVTLLIIPSNSNWKLLGYDMERTNFASYAIKL